MIGYFRGSTRSRNTLVVRTVRIYNVVVIRFYSRWGSGQHREFGGLAGLDNDGALGWLRGYGVFSLGGEVCGLLAWRQGLTLGLSQRRRASIFGGWDSLYGRLFVDHLVTLLTVLSFALSLVSGKAH